MKLPTDARLDTWHERLVLWLCALVALAAVGLYGLSAAWDEAAATPHGIVAAAAPEALPPASPAPDEAEADAGAPDAHAALY